MLMLLFPRTKLSPFPRYESEEGGIWNVSCLPKAKMTKTSKELIFFHLVTLEVLQMSSSTSHRLLLSFVCLCGWYYGSQSSTSNQQNREIELSLSQTERNFEIWNLLPDPRLRIESQECRYSSSRWGMVGILTSCFLQVRSKACEALCPTRLFSVIRIDTKFVHIFNNSTRSIVEVCRNPVRKTFHSKSVLVGFHRFDFGLCGNYPSGAHWNTLLMRPHEERSGQAARPPDGGRCSRGSNFASCLAEQFHQRKH